MPGGMVMSLKRMPTVWLLLSRTSSRSELVSDTLPEFDSSASSAPAAIRRSRLAAETLVGVGVLVAGGGVSVGAGVWVAVGVGVPV